MLRRYSVNFELFSILLDALAVFASLCLVNIVHFWARHIFDFIHPVPTLELPGIYYAAFPIVWVYLNLGLSLYDGYTNKLFVDEFGRLFLSALLAMVSLAGLIFFASLEFSHSLYLVFIFTAFCLMGIWRVFVRLYWRAKYSNSEELRRILIVGAGDTGRKVASHLARPPASNLEIVGFLDDDPGKLARAHDVLGAIDDLDNVVNFYRINILLIALPSNTFNVTSSIVERMRMKPVRIWIVPDEYHLSLSQCDVIGQLCDIPLLDVRAPSISDKQRLLKRLFDLMFATVAIALSLPVMVVIAILIKLDSPGPIFFRQKRVGENTQPFEMLKFRTMIQNAEAMSASLAQTDADGNVVHKRRGDPRVTRIGRFLRHYSFDELPQIFNVLLGKMSMVGPRPEMPFLVEKYKGWQYARFTIPQGITGWWQITGRSDKPMHLNTEDDMYYIRNYSIWLDIKIILRTISTVISGRGAY
ncbi:sugar transferase [Chloroflexota bacterium]